MRSTRSFVFLCAKLWMVDYKLNRRVLIPNGYLNFIKDLRDLFLEFRLNYNYIEWHKKIRYIDYTDEDFIKKVDMKDNLIAHKNNKQPQLTLDFDCKVYIKLKNINSFNEIDSNLDIISFLLYFSCKSQQIVKFHFDDVMIKPSPSIAARHGIEVFVFYNKNYYYYNCVEHALVLYRENIHEERFFDDVIALDIYIRPSVYMWRYKSSSYLTDVYFDIGHILANIGLVNSLNNGFTIAYEACNKYITNFEKGIYYTLTLLIRR